MQIPIQLRWDQLTYFTKDHCTVFNLYGFSFKRRITLPEGIRNLIWKETFPFFVALHASYKTIYTCRCMYDDLLHFIMNLVLAVDMGKRAYRVSSPSYYANETKTSSEILYIVVVFNRKRWEKTQKGWVGNFDLSLRNCSQIPHFYIKKYIVQSAGSISWTLFWKLYFSFIRLNFSLF